jgi:hypothetical protein
VFALLALGKSQQPKRDFAWFVITLLLASPNTASYTFIMLLLPLVLLLECAGWRERILLVTLYVLLSLPIRREWAWLFPKLWLLLALFLIVGRNYWFLLKPKPAISAAVLVTVIAALAAAQRFSSYAHEPGQRWERIALERGAVYSSHPAVLRSGIVYESIAQGHYELRRLRGDRVDRYSFAGEALNPVALSPDGPVQFELVAHGRSATWLLDLDNGIAEEQKPSTRQDVNGQVRSPDGNWVAFIAEERGTKQVWMRNQATSIPTRLTAGNCNSFSPAWQLDSKAVIFASDCDRGLGLPSLYRARLDNLSARQQPFLIHRDFNLAVVVPVIRFAETKSSDERMIQPDILGKTIREGGPAALR